MHGNQRVLKIAVLKYYSVSKRGTTAKSNLKQATDPTSLHTKFGDNSSNTFPLNERKPCVTPDIGRRTSDGGKSKNNISTPPGLIPYPMDNCFTGRHDRSRQTSEKDGLYILPAGPVTECAFARWRMVLHFLFTY